MSRGRRILRNRRPTQSAGLSDNRVFCQCSACGGDVRYYQDGGVRCSICSKLYGIHGDRRDLKRDITNLLKKEAVVGDSVEEDIVIDEEGGTED